MSGWNESGANIFLVNGAKAGLSLDVAANTKAKITSPADISSVKIGGVIKRRETEEFETLPGSIEAATVSRVYTSHHGALYETPGE